MGYTLLSKYRSELMGAALCWIMLYHAWLLDVPFLNFIRATGYGGVDIFIILSAMGLVVSLSRKPQTIRQFISRRLWRILPAYYLIVMPYTVFRIWRGTSPVSALFWNATLLGYFVNAEGTFNWYVSTILLFYLVTPFLFRWLKKIKTPGAAHAGLDRVRSGSEPSGDADTHLGAAGYALPYPGLGPWPADRLLCL